MLLGLAGLVLGVFVLIGAPVYGIFLLFVSVGRRKKKVICPYCRKRHMLLADVRSYVCDRCAHILLFSNSKTRNMTAVTCNICGMEWAASVDMETLDVFPVAKR